MAGPRRTIVQVDGDGVRTLKTPGIRVSVWLLALAMTLVGVSVFVIFRPAVDGYLHARPEPPPPQAVAAPRAPAPPVDKRPRPASVSRVEPPPVPAAKVATVEPPAVREDEPQPPAPGDAAAAAGAAPEDLPEEDQGGIGVFPPPGTKPIKQGIVVPEDFELPPGYVRHYQATDDGKMLPAILMFHPDYQPVDEHGNPIPLPENRVVPPDLAPPGMPVQMLEVPEVHVPMIQEPEGETGQDAAP